MKEAEEDIAALKKSDPLAYDRVLKLVGELQKHPRTGMGKPESLRYRPGLWSRRITWKYWLVYMIEDDEVKVLVLSARGHYGDK
ncbi:MAG: Txe/YoeB family addiction module toxin [Heliobacteriaceae bacterium]|jgi:toxin YoeB|nr:Txe/YoeB family addiction module toxin [Heliobacteriaceae bacterium]